VQALEHAAQSRQLEVRYRALFNLGLVYLERARALTDQDAATQAYSAAADLYKRALRLRPHDVDAKWNYELAHRQRPEPKSGGGGGGGGSAQQHGPPPTPQNRQNRPAGGLDERQAEQLLQSAARDERDVQGRKQRQNQVERPPGGKDW
jgi:Ca-activated chloride channel family protein